MFSDPDQDIRTYSIHIADQLNLIDSLIDGAFDRRENTRFYAREYLIKRKHYLNYP